MKKFTLPKDGGLIEAGLPNGVKHTYERIPAHIYEDEELACERLGEKNVIKTAVRETLLANGNADVLVGLNTQIKYDTKGQLESITVTGYPAKYVNFRSPSDEEILKLKADNGSTTGGFALPFMKRK